jgi:hypothetical protein
MCGKTSIEVLAHGRCVPGGRSFTGGVDGKPSIEVLAHGRCVPYGS